ncbi:unnamed protein product, partial [Tetraodon nigroviridis]
SIRKRSCCLTRLEMGRSATASVGRSCELWDRTPSMPMWPKSWATPNRKVSRKKPQMLRIVSEQ